VARLANERQGRAHPGHGGSGGRCARDHGLARRP
jgi:hypothetical protein